MSNVIVRAYNKDGYHKDLVMMNERQIHTAMHGIMDEPVPLDNLGQGVCAVIDPAKFPEMVKFVVIVSR